VLDTPKAFAKSVAGAGAHDAEAYTEHAQKAAATVSGQAARLTDICEAPGPAPAGGPRLSGGPGAGLRAGGANPGSDPRADPAGTTRRPDTARERGSTRHSRTPSVPVKMTNDLVRR